MEILKIVAVGIVSAIIIIYLRQINTDLSLIASVSAGILIFYLTSSYVSEFLSMIYGISSISEETGKSISLIIKIIAISYIVEFSASTIEDFGLKSLSEKVVFAGKIIIVSMSFPIIKNMITTVYALL